MVVELEERLLMLLSELCQADDSSIGLDTELLLSGLLDSIGVIRLASEIEKITGMEVPPIDVTIENFESLRAILTYINNKMDK